MKTFLTISLLGLLFLSACAFNDKDMGDATLRVYLTDSPAEYEEVMIDILRVEVNRSTSGDSGWFILSDTPMRIDLLSLVNGVDTLLGEADLTPGSYRQMRLILGSQNTVTVNGVVHNLTTPSAQQSGLKLNINTQLEGGVTYDILLDFDAAKSIVLTGGPNAKYILKPTIRVITEATSGAVSGKVLPITAASMVSVITSSDTLNTYADLTTGEFVVRGVPSGNWAVKLSSSLITHRDTTLTGVSVSIGGTTNVGTVTLPAN